jgi:cytochrome c553
MLGLLAFVIGMNMIRESLFAAILAVPAGVMGQAPEAKPAPPADKAQQSAETVCAACHGPHGSSAIPANPSLAGQDAGYITRQLQAFKSGVRSNDIMKAMVAALSDEDMAALGTYYARQASSPGPATATPTAAQAQATYLGGDIATGLPSCAACPGPVAWGATTYYPRLAGQHADYLYAQLKAFKSGTRGADKDGRDAHGKIMWAVAQRLPEPQMRPLADYLAGLR